MDLSPDLPVVIILISLSDPIYHDLLCSLFPTVHNAYDCTAESI